MIVPSATDLLNLWEQGQGQPPARRALWLLAGAFPEEDGGALAQLPIGQRDARLLRLRAACFGHHMESVARCPKCGDQVELSFETGDIWAGDVEGSGEAYMLQADGFDVTFRLPNSVDLLDLSAESSQDVSHRLLERCLIRVELEGQPVSPGDLPEQVCAAVMAQMEVLDPQAEVTLALRCPVCGYGWAVLFDVVSFFWAEVDSWARRTLGEVHVLASAYGWREADVLDLSAWRRQFYLEQVLG